jgi:hypothetical protein
METLLIKVDTKENKAFLRELLQKFDFVVEVEVKSDSPKNPIAETTNVGGLLKAYADKEMTKDKKTSAVDFVNKWAGFLKEIDVEKSQIKLPSHPTH